MNPWIVIWWGGGVPVTETSLQWFKTHLVVFKAFLLCVLRCRLEQLSDCKAGQFYGPEEEIEFEQYFLTCPSAQHLWK